MVSLLTFLLLSSFTVNAQDSSKSCLKLTDDFCHQLYSPENQGNFEKIKLGQTRNDINYSKYFFLKAFESSFKTFKPDMQKAFSKANLPKRIQTFTSRKNRSQTSISDIYRTEWSSDNIDVIGIAIEQLANERTEKVIPGYIRETLKDTPIASDDERRRIIDQIWAELFQKVWQNQNAWIEVKEKFENLRTEYLKWADEDKSVSNDLRSFRLQQLKSLQLIIPGSEPTKDYTRNFRCGIDEMNAFYEPVRHTLTVCAGIFTSSDSVQILAHEIGHSVSNSRRVIKYLESSELGQNFLQIWQDSQRDKHLTCDQFSDYKKSFEKNVKALPPYKYDDELFLQKFISRELKGTPNQSELRKISERLAKKTLKDEVRYHSIDRMLKKSDVLETGRLVPNKSYLNPQGLNRSPLFITSLITAAEYFNHFFAEEYNCLLNEKLKSPKEALEAALLEAQRMNSFTWQMLLTIGGKYSFFNDAIEEELAQDIEEDVVDSYGSVIMSRLLSKIPTLAEKRSRYLNSLAFYCDPISFTQIYPEEAGILHKFTGALHSIGQDRRKKLLTSEIKSILQCD